MTSPSESQADDHSSRQDYAASWRNPIELAKRFRSDEEGCVRFILSEYYRIEPSTPESFRASLQIQITSSFRDACRLDQLALDSGKAACYLERFMESVFVTKGFFVALCHVAQVPADQKAWAPAQQAKRAGRNLTAPLLLYQIREDLKDGVAPERVLGEFAAAIGDELAKGDLEFLKRLAVAFRSPPQRSLADWIRRAWLPLALWQDVAPSVKESRLTEAAEVLIASGLTLRSFREASAKNPYPLSKHIATVEGRILAHMR